jgi:hypothetical protein
VTIFTTTDYPINALIEDIDLGEIGLPDLQRPFVWPNVNVRNLFDSLYRGYPAGFLLFWETGAEGRVRVLNNKNNTIAKKAIVDGQQRLTSLYAVMKGAEVVRKNFKKERIRIAFNPLEERFDVLDAAIGRDKAYIPDISVLWNKDVDIFEFVGNYFEELQTTREITPDQRKAAGKAISQLHKLPSYQFVALTLNSNVGGDEVADVFVRINGQGKKLNQSDFILTLMSVYWDEGRAQLEEFARQATIPSAGQSSPFNYFIAPSPDQMLRVSIGLGLKRGRLKTVYNVLRGRDAQTGLDDESRRDAQFAKLIEAQQHVLNLTNWHHFLSALTLAGFRGSKMISSQATVIFAYAIYLIGLVEYRIDRSKLRQAVAEFFFMAALTGRYTSSPESAFESDLGALSELSSGEAFLNRLREMCQVELTNDYWEIQLPNQLATSGSVTPSLYAYHAAQVVLDAPVLFSKLKVSNLLDPSQNAPKSALERHHLYPKNYLNSIGVTDQKRVNQIANFAMVEWPENLKISNQAPSEYMKEFDGSMDAKDRERFYTTHALKPLWWEMDYEAFLRDRRVRMAKVVKSAWQELTHGTTEADTGTSHSIVDLISEGETDAVEFKSTLRTNLHTDEFDTKIENSALKTIVGFLNAKGGKLLIGVSDDGTVLGFDADRFPNEDKMSLHLINLIRGRMGEVFLPYIHPRFEGGDDERVLVVNCEKGPKPAFLKDGNLDKFFVRGGNATTELSGNAIVEYIRRRFPDYS